MILKTPKLQRVPMEHNGAIMSLYSETASIYSSCIPSWEHIFPLTDVLTLGLCGIPTRKTNFKNTNSSTQMAVNVNLVVTGRDESVFFSFILDLT